MQHMYMVLADRFHLTLISGNMTLISGNKSKGDQEVVQAKYQRKVYEAQVLDIGEYVF